MNANHVHRVANEADVVTMVPCYPFVHSPYVHGTYLLDGGWLKINPMVHRLGDGYASMLGAVMAYLGRSSVVLANASAATIRWVFGLLDQSVTTMDIRRIIRGPNIFWLYAKSG
ncbi:hypothetical protein [Limnobacter sp.]|uniref:hypothetical protein n=1 Tax=Limnobacter sp. TaxID=2003368 RepID=UPI003516762F